MVYKDGIRVRLSADISDYCKSYGQVNERFEVISLFNMVDDMHSEVCKFTIGKESLSIGSNATMCQISSCFRALATNLHGVLQTQ